MASHRAIDLGLYLTFGILGFIFNVTEIFLIIRTLKKRKTAIAFELYLLSLSCADLLVVASLFAAVPLSFQLLVPDSIRFATATSVGNILAIGFDRFMVVKYPLKYRIWMSPARAKIIILVVWLLGLTFSVVLGLIIRYSPRGAPDPSMFHQSSSVVYISSSAVLLFGIIFIMLHAYIVWKVIWKGPELEQVQIRGKANHPYQRTTASLYQRPLVLTCVLVVLAYLVCTYPVAIEMFILLVRKSKYSNTIYLVYLNSVLNPIIYFYKSYLERKMSECRISTCKKDSTENEHHVLKNDYVEHTCGSDGNEKT